ncbi:MULTISPECIES: acetoin utilization protein AcuC [Actinoalloteichus]|uniref:Acetoin utilization protein AcuC n=1 Tax=Actinoalloteichus fjordicus TaxID=1612552 RepID=A0AAC9LCK1_9PSEU|nr:MULTISPECIES: acetoin utilization protein AcuC [Actinoalloteichus]APU13814.1 deacetylase, histone deacetylase/acetoin utilization protein [Actinoalloteichus fjordicus]APU19760.1 deacetylase, histone deacetylase/acetoin utilization protein [Actinoalloteichus sp. GBA129-24]
MASAAIVWDENLLGYDMGESHPLTPVRLDLTMRLARELGVLDGISLVRPVPADETLLAAIHDREYLAAVRAASAIDTEPASELPSRFGLGTVDNPIFPDMHESSALIAGASVAAAREIVEGRVDRAVNIAGGLHHAMADRAAGFCVYNDCVAAIAWLLDQGLERIAYLDVDVHHGDGVQAAFQYDPRVLTMSVHQHPMTLWPGTGGPADVGGPGAEGRAVNLALPPGTDDAGWQRAFHAVVPSLLAAFEPQLLVTQCGVDTHREDPLADLALTVDGHRAIYRTLRDLAETHAGGRWLALGGGGYSPFRVVPRSWTHLLAVLLDRDLAPETTIPAGWRAHAARLAPPDTPIPVSMSDDGHGDASGDAGFPAWDGEVSHRVDRALLATRRAVFPLFGLDPEDRRD